ncbi:MAG: TonB-dependent receptor, partial [Archangium sp.]|nr:TonB-dependent receptor [Archangium sp.]
DDVDTTRTLLPGSTQRRLDDSRAFSYIAKLTFLINSDNNISLTVQGTPASSNSPFSFNEKRKVGNWNGGTNGFANTTTVSLRYQGGFLDKHLLLDVSGGWFRINGTTLPNDGSGFNFVPGDGTAAGTPAVIYRRTAPRIISAFETISPEATTLCNTLPDGSTATAAQAAAMCPGAGAGSTYTIGGFGFLQEATLDRISAKASVTFLAQALGHHIFKAGADYEHIIYDLKKAYSGAVLLRESASGATFADYRQYGYYTAPDEATRQNVIISRPTSNGMAAFLQDSWSIMDLVTLNAGLRYENQQLISGDGSLGMTLNNMLSPRVGLIYDFTQQGRSKLFANYSRYYESVPMDIADRALTGENQYQFIRRARANDPALGGNGNPGCNPLADISQASNECLDQKNVSPINTVSGGDYDPNASGLQTGAGKTPVDPNLQPQSSDEIVVGGEYEIISDGRLGASYTRRWMNSVIEDMSIDEASTYFIGNPGSGLGAQFPKAVRDYDAVSVYFTKAFSDGWQGQVSYTFSSLRGNYNGLFRPETGQLDPNINADFDLVSLLPNRTGPLDADRNHFIKLYAAKEFQITNSFSIVAGLTYEGRSGAPLNYFGSHVLYGADEVFVLPRGAAGRLPWRHAINAKLGISYRITKDNVVQFTTDVFNMFNFQAVTAVDQTITQSDVLPFVTNAKDPQTAACLAGNNQPQCAGGNTAISTTAQDADGNYIPLTKDELNTNFKQPTAYQSPISVRFGIRFSF